MQRKVETRLMYVKIIKGVGWNNDMEGKIFRVLSSDENNIVSQFKSIYPVEHPDNSNEGVKSILKQNCVVIEEEEALKMISNEFIKKLASITGVSTKDVIESIKTLANTDGVGLKTPLNPREQVVEDAKTYIEDLKREGRRNGFAWEYREYPEGRDFFYKGAGEAYNAEFIVNREKKTVVCLLRAYNKRSTVLKRGIAKCLPEDCFNEYIGKAIALGKALKQPIPDQLINSPQPIGFKEGDRVIFHYNDQNHYIVVNFNPEVYEVTVRNAITGEEFKVNRIPNKVIDDSARYR